MPKLLRPFWGLLSTILLCGIAHAQDRSFSPQLFHPAPGPDQFVVVESAVPLTHKGFGFGLYFNYARNEIQLSGYDVVNMRPSGAHADLIANALSADVWAGVGLWNRLQIAVSLPMVLSQSGTDFDDTSVVPRGAHVTAPSGFALGDPRLHLKFRFYGKDRGFQI